MKNFKNKVVIFWKKKKISIKSYSNNKLCIRRLLRILFNYRIIRRKQFNNWKIKFNKERKKKKQNKFKYKKPKKN